MRLVALQSRKRAHVMVRTSGWKRPGERCQHKPPPFCRSQKVSLAAWPMSLIRDVVSSTGGIELASSAPRLGNNL